MVRANSRKTGRGKAVEYKAQDLDDDGPMKDLLRTPPGNRYHTEEHPAKKLCRGLRFVSPPSSDEDFNFARVQGETEADYDHEISSSMKREPRPFPPSTSKAKAKGKAKARLCTLFDRLPTEIIYTIFSHLHPSDLLRLARTNRMLRSHLMSRSSAGVWKEARKRVEPQVPDCPSNHSEPQWAYLLFSRDCSTCERTNVSNVDWNHRLRLCSRCGNSGVILIVGSKARKAFPAILDVELLLDLLPHSNRGSSRVETYYRMKDIEDIGAEWATMREKSEAEIQEFKNRKESEAKEIMAHGTLCKAWDRDCKILKDKQRNEVKEARRNELFSRLEALGHHPEDVRDSQVTDHASFNTSAALTEKRWETIRPALEALVEDIKTRRLQRERSQIIDQRQALAESLLKTYQVPSYIPRAFQKPLEEFLFWPSFSFIIHQPNEVSVTASDFQPALDELPDLLAHSAKEIQADLLRRMIDGGATDINPSSIGLVFAKILPESHLDEIQLATSTFFCRSEHNGLPFCGKDDLGTHSCYVGSRVKHHCLYYDRRASNVVAALLAIANLDPNTTVERMDEMDLRFYRPGWPKQTAPLALNWRDAVSHARTSGELQSSSWKIFSLEETAAIRAKEMANTGDRRYRFRCNTCTHTGWIRRQDLESHLKFQHSIVDHPIPTMEFHLHPRYPPQPVTFPLSDKSST